MVCLWDLSPGLLAKRYASELKSDRKKSPIAIALEYVIIYLCKKYHIVFMESTNQEWGFEDIESFLTEETGNQCWVEGYYKHGGHGEIPNGTDLLRVWINTEGWKWFTHTEDTAFQEIEYEINHWTVCIAENEDFPWDEILEDEA